MTGKSISVALILLFVGQQAFGAELAEMKANALNKIKLRSAEVSDAFKKTSAYYNGKVVYRAQIKWQKMDLGQSLRELHAYEINQLVEGSKQKAKLLSSPPKVSECIEEAREKAINKAETTFTKSFVQPVQNFEAKARDKEAQLVAKWYDDYYKTLEVYNVQEDRAIDEIKSTNSKAYVETLLAHLEKVAQETIDQILSLSKMFATSEIRFDRTLEKGPVKTLRTSGRRIIDDFQETVANCFLVV